MKNYSVEFYKSRTDSLISAKEIVPFIIENFAPKSVLDVGCGTGEFLYVFTQFGVNDIIGVDGEWVPKSMLKIPENNFKAIDLNKHFDLSRKFDLVISLEVAEHLRPESAKGFVNSLIKHSDIILFSAAIPYQGGVNHFNEQWPEYWAKIFKDFNYLPLDILRELIWDNPKVSYWYKQNAIFYIKEDLIKDNEFLRVKFEQKKNSPLNLVHPELFIKNMKEKKFFQKMLTKIQSKISSFFKNNS